MNVHLPQEVFMIENRSTPNTSEKKAWFHRPFSLMILTGLISIGLLAWLLARYPIEFSSPAAAPTLAVLLVDTGMLLFLVRNPIPAPISARPARTGRLVLLILACGLVFFTLPVFFKGQILYAFPPIAILSLVLLKQRISRRELIFSGGLALVAGTAGLANGGLKAFTPLAWATLQVFLILTGLLCGWKVLAAYGLNKFGVGRSRLLDAGPSAAIRGFGIGALLAIPWALGNIVLGSYANDTWVRAWWQPFVAIQPGIAEEAWGRLLVIPLLYLVFRLAAQPRTAFAIALLFGAYWFAYLHTPMGLAGFTGTILTGTLYGLPVAYLCLYRDLETAIGWHFAVDFVRFLTAYIILARIP
jgi:hypothetical protein